MSSGLGNFLASAAIVVTGMTGMWAWPILQDGGFRSVVATVTDVYHRADLRLRPAIAALQTPGELNGAALIDPAAISESLAPDNLAPIEPLMVSATAPVVPPQCEATEGDEDTAVIGDRLQIRIFESSALASVPAADGAEVPPTDIVFERLDLSGTYEVGATGEISLPAIGHIDVAGHGLSCIEMLVSRGAFERIRTQNTVSAAFAARPSILVRGAVRAPGGYAHSPGLTVERVLAQAGAIDHDPTVQLRLVTLRARRMDLYKSRTSLALERTRIQAALDDRDSLDNDDPSMQAALALLGEERVERESSTLATDHEAEQLRQVRSDALMTDLTARIESARQQVDAAEKQVNYYDGRHEQQSEMLQSGFITDAKLNDTLARIMDAERILLEKQDLLFRLEAELRLVGQDAALARIERRKSLTSELRQITAASDAAESEYNGVVAELNLLEDEDTKLGVTIDRPLDSATATTLIASADTLVRPGDLITVQIEQKDTDLASAPREVLQEPIRSASK
ncbi:polysaccharide biosynthesis/export family protein [Paracoccus sp. TK19116]|uniref:Polysaccharide biosynthesis/export family protein n=1 Tax=Paracoccus albicereus TaxID=2922394 RepID=A0ABT1MSY7_9RHOB|nr:polysaccharide biosynthesis/export family protein [Paracoccus albicereus]MCQ0971430.1 polysaccharide biosynthesis/export family protein [Paracoccus albicereus]